MRRSLFAQSSGLGSGVYWEWANDEGSWTPYETRTSILLEHSYQARQGTADLGPHGYNYIVDLTSLAQVNKATGFRRQVRRQCNLPYPLASSGPPAIPSGLACSCQQCLSHSSTGPMPSRSRHSFTSGSLNRPSLQGTGRATAAHPTSVYSPYPRRPLSVGGMSWGSPWPPPPSGSQLPAPLLTSSASANGLRSVSDDLWLGFEFHTHMHRLEQHNGSDVPLNHLANRGMHDIDSISTLPFPFVFHSPL